MKTTVNDDDDYHQFKPVTRPNARLHGLGVMDVMAGVRMEPELMKGERENLEVDTRQTKLGFCTVK